MAAGGPAAGSPQPAQLRVAAAQNVTIGGAFVAAGSEGTVPDVPELHEAAARGLLRVVGPAEG